MFHDIFDTFTEKIDFYKKLLESQKNKRVVLFNYPCQAFTVYKSNTAYHNMRIADIFDSLMYHLDQNSYINVEKNTFKFVGYGYGGNILLYYRKNTKK